MSDEEVDKITHDLEAIRVYRDAPIIAGTVQPKGSITGADGKQIVDTPPVETYLNENGGKILEVTGSSRRGSWQFRGQWVRSTWQKVATGSPIPVPIGQRFLVDDENNYLIDDAGNFLTGDEE